MTTLGEAIVKARAEDEQERNRALLAECRLLLLDWYLSFDVAPNGSLIQFAGTAPIIELQNRTDALLKKLEAIK